MAARSHLEVWIAVRFVEVVSSDRDAVAAPGIAEKYGEECWLC
jgi:hypothetical protein